MTPVSFPNVPPQPGKHIEQSILIMKIFHCRIQITLADTAIITLRPRRNGYQFTDDIIKCIFLKTCKFRLRFHWSLFLRVQLKLFQHWFRWWFGAGQVYWRMYVSLGLNELSASNIKGYQRIADYIPSFLNLQIWTPSIFCLPTWKAINIHITITNWHV